MTTLPTAQPTPSPDTAENADKPEDAAALAPDSAKSPAPPRSSATAALRALGQRAAPLAFVAGAVALILYGRSVLLAGGDVVGGLVCVAAGAGAFLLARAAVGGKIAWRRWWLVPGGLALGAAAHALAGEGPLMEHPLLAPLAWLLGVGLVAAALWRRDETPTPFALPWPRAEIAGVAALFVAALLLRLIGNNAVPAMLTGDEGSAALNAVAVTKGEFNNPFTIGWFSFPSLFFLLPGVAIKVLGQTYGALRTPSALAGALTVVGLYLWARPMFGRLVAGLAALMLAALNYHIHFSRIGLNNIWDGLFAVLVLGAWWRAWQEGRRRWHFLLAGALLGLSQFFYTGARLLPIVLLGWCVLLALTGGWPELRQHWRNIASAAAMALAVYLPLGLYFWNHPAEYAAPANRVSLLVSQLGDPNQSWLAKTSAETGKPRLLLLAENYRDSFLGFVGKPLRAWYESGQPMLLAAPTALFVLGLAIALVGLRDRRYWLPLLLLGGVVSLGAITESTPAAQRYIMGAPVAALLVGVALATLCRFMGELAPPKRQRPLVAGLALVAGIAIAAVDLRFYFYDYIPHGGHGDTNTQVASQLAQRLAGYPAGAQVYTFTAPRLVYTGFSTLPFMAPQVVSTDVLDPITSPPTWQLPGPRAAFVFLPERASEAALVRQRYPGGAEQWFYDSDAQQLFLMYEVEGARQ